MPLNNDEDYDDVPKNHNPYLDDPRQGLALVAQLLTGASRMTDSHINRTLDTMIAACDRLTFANEEHPLKRLSALVEYFKTSLLEGILQETRIVGFGGAFSAGKSAVLNSLMKDGVEFQLPEDQSASTSIPTYILYGEQSKVTACTKKGRAVPLDAGALEALSHEFRKKYTLNTAQYFDCIAITLPQFPVKNIALLDTPGYNASDNGATQEHTDQERSRIALSSIDHLVWLISAGEPLLSDKDARFINGLNLANPVTVVVNKCDLIESIEQSDEPESTSQIQHIREDFKKAGIAYTTVIPYIARKPDWNNGREEILSNLRSISTRINNENRITELEAIISTINKYFQEILSTKYSKMMQKFDSAIDQYPNVFDLKALAHLRSLTGVERANLQHDAQVFEKHSKELVQWVRNKQSVAR
jgi:GTP-binding protein EngB required for normal cell division